MAFADRCFDGGYEEDPADEVAGLRAKLQAAEEQAEKAETKVENQRKELRLLQDATSLNEKYYKYAQQLRVAKESGAYALLIAEHAETLDERDGLATANAELAAHCERLLELLKETVAALVDYEQNADCGSPPKHYAMMCAARSALAATPAQSIRAIERRAVEKAMREARFDDACWPGMQKLPREQFLANCSRFYECLNASSTIAEAETVYEIAGVATIYPAAHTITEIDKLRSILTEERDNAVRYSDLVIADRASLRAQNAELTAHCEQLKKVMGEIHDRAENWHYSVEWEGQEYTGAVMELVDAALAATPAQSLDRIERRAAVKALREVRRNISPSWGFCQIADFITDEAERLEKESGK